MEREITEFELSQHYEKFTPIYNEKGKEVNPMPSGKEIIVYCDNGSDEKGFAEVNDRDELGLTALIAKSWMTREHFLKLL